MFSVVFEVHPKNTAFGLYLDLAKELRPILQRMDGFIDNERFESVRRPGWILSHSTWRDEKAVVRWRTTEKHHQTQQRGREDVFDDYHLRVGEIVADSTPPFGLSVLEQRLDETEVGSAKFLTLIELEPTPSGDQAPRRSLELLQQALDHAGVTHDAFESIYNPGKLALLVSWLDRAPAEQFDPSIIAHGKIRHRIIRVVRDYGMFDRRESPQYYPDVVPTAG